MREQQHQENNVLSGSKDIEDDDELPMDKYYEDGTHFDMDEQEIDL